MPDYAKDVRKALNALKFDTSIVSDSEFQLIVAEAVKIGPQIARSLGSKDSAAKIADVLTHSGALKSAANNLSRQTRATSVAVHAAKSNIGKV